MGRRVRIFHLSDLHARSTSGPQGERATREASFRHRVIGSAWDNHLRELKADGIAVDLVVFTGDLGDWGHETDYAQGVAFLRRTCEALEVPLERLFVVPGNHDIARKTEEKTWKSLRKRMTSEPPAMSEWMAGGKPPSRLKDAAREAILHRQAAFWNAVTVDLGRTELAPRNHRHRRLGYQAKVQLEGLRAPLWLIGLDTSWLAGDEHDTGKLWLTEHQLGLHTTDPEGAELPGFRLALMHHRFSDLADGDRARRLLADRVDLLLHGHQHEPMAEPWTSPDHHLLVLAAGCLYEGDAQHRYLNACQLIDVDLTDDSRPVHLTVRFRGWSERNLFWGDDSLLYRNAPGGRLELDRGAQGWHVGRRESAPTRQARKADVRNVAEGPVALATPPGASALTRAFDYSSEREKHQGFLGRERLLAQLDQLLLDDPTDRWVVVTGGPGMGKSALLTAWIERRQTAGDSVPHHFIRRGQFDWDNPAKLVGSLIAQLEAGFPGLREDAGFDEIHPSNRLVRILRRISTDRLCASGKRLVIVIDGLDEYDSKQVRPGLDPLADFLPGSLPAGVRFLCATRPRHPYLDRLMDRYGAVRQLDLDAPAQAADNHATVRAFWEREAVTLGVDATFIAAAVERAAGNLQHATMLRKQLEGKPAQECVVEDIPRGLGSLLSATWERVSQLDAVIDGLGILCAAYEPLTLDELTLVAAWTVRQRGDFESGASEFLYSHRRAAGPREYRLQHESIRAFVADRIGGAALSQHHRALAAKYASWPQPEGAAARGYTLRYALRHCVEAGDWPEAWRLASDMSFMEAKYRELGVHDAEADVAHAAERCRVGGNETLHRQFADLTRALERESHWLRVAPEATAALVWNRLRLLGWSAEEADAHLQIPQGASFLRLRHFATRESPALVRELVGHTGHVTACAVTPDGRRVVSASDDRTLKVWDLKTGREVVTLQGHAAAVNACAVTPDGRRVVSASHDRTLKVWDLETGLEVVTLKGHMDIVTACAVTPNGQRVVSISEDGALKAWELETGLEAATLQSSASSLSNCPVTSDGRKVVFWSTDGVLKVGDLETGLEVVPLEGDAYEVRACAVTPDGRQVVSASLDGTLKVWDLETAREMATLQGHSTCVKACAVTPDGRRVVSASSDRTLKVWDLDKGEEIATLQGHAAAVNACAVTPDGRRVVSASSDRTLKVWDLETAQGRSETASDAFDVSALAVTPNEQRVVSLSRTPKTWDLETGQQVATLQGDASTASACTVTPDGRHVVSWFSDGKLKVWDVETGQRVATLLGNTSIVRACVVTLDEWRVVLSWCSETLVLDLEIALDLLVLREDASRVTACAARAPWWMWREELEDRTLSIGHLVKTEREVARFQSPLLGGASSGKWYSNWGYACAVTRNGQHVVSASQDGTLRVWRLATGLEVATLQGHAEAVHTCAVTPDGRCVLSGSEDRTLKLWDLETGACILTHYASASITAVAASTATIVACDTSGATCFLDFPSREQRNCSTGDNGHAHEPPPTSLSSIPSSQRPSMKPTPRVDIGILTIRDDEFRAVLDVFPSKAGIFKGTKTSREYTLRHADAGDGERYTIAVLCQVEQGNGEAQNAARDLIEDFAPRLILVVGIAGSVPSADVTLGDVVLSMRIHDFTLEARGASEEPTYSAAGGPIAKALAAAIANLPAREDELGDWSANLPVPPAVVWTGAGQIYGPPDWQEKLRAKLEYHYGANTTPRAPIYISGPIASSDRLVKDPAVVIPWLQTTRKLLAIEMESGGVYRAAQERCPMLAIRGISDIVGLKRDEAWIKYACASAAAFTRAFLRTQPVPVSDP